jgi:ABC-type multidrug transport system permease subunit
VTIYDKFYLALKIIFYTGISLLGIWLIYFVLSVLNVIKYHNVYIHSLMIVGLTLVLVGNVQWNAEIINEMKNEQQKHNEEILKKMNHR